MRQALQREHGISVSLRTVERAVAQALYVDPAAEMVIARFGSHPLAGNLHLDPVTLPAFHAMAQHLKRG